jgi:26S proteasome regulatory subunit T2
VNSEKQKQKQKQMGKAKEAIVVAGALAFVWLTIELALKPFLSQTRDSIDKSDPTRDPDDDALDTAAAPAIDAGDTTTTTTADA